MKQVMQVMRAGRPVEWDMLPVGQARNMCIHESQSLLFEKQIFLSRSFTSYFTPVIHEHLPDSRRFDNEQIWRANIRVQPSFIRVDADEVTYPLHIVLRFEIESGLMNGTVQPEDVPDLWNEKMEHYLGLSDSRQLQKRLSPGYPLDRWLLWLFPFLYHRRIE